MIPVISIVISLTAIILESYSFILGPGTAGLFGIDSMMFMRIGVYAANAAVALSLVGYLIGKIRKKTIKNSFAAIIFSIVVLIAPLLAVILVMMKG